MPKLPRISSKKAIKALEKLGFQKVRQTGSHVVMKKITSDGQIGCIWSNWLHCTDTSRVKGGNFKRYSQTI